MRRLLLPMILALLLPSTAAAADVPEVVVPEARPIQLDGDPRAAEWSEAAVFELAPGTVLRMQQFRGTVMLAFESDRVWIPGSVLTLFLCREGPKAGGRGPGCLRIDYEPFRHDRRHAIVHLHDEQGVAHRAGREVVVRQQIGPAGARLEMAFAARVLGLTPEDRGPVRLCAQWARQGNHPLHYPGNISLRAPPGTPPPDFVSAQRWARLTGFGDPTGAGAFPAAEWEAWVDHDDELTRRGRAAHDRIALLREEWQQEEKRDDEMLEAVVDNLTWVREHEPLTDDDVIAMATLWRYLGRHDLAIGALSTIVETGRDRARVMQALHARTLARRAAERYDAEAADWRRLAAMVGPQGARYLQAAEQAEQQKALWEKEQAARAAVEADPANPRVILQTERGTVLVVLHAKAVPEAVKHFLSLVDQGVYDDTRFHRVKGDFMAQGGDPDSRPGGGPTTPMIPMEINPDHDFFRGALAFARTAQEEKNGSQFFLMNAPKPGLGRYTIFGHVVAGMPAVDRLEKHDALIQASRASK